MADLLECLLQIKGLRETAGRVAALAEQADEQRWAAARTAGGASARDLVWRLAETELRHGTWLRLMLSSSQPVLGLSDPPAASGDSVLDTLQLFLRRRHENAERLERCSAADLSRTGVLGAGADARGRTITVADLVAIMLATDVDLVGELRHALAPAR